MVYEQIMNRLQSSEFDQIEVTELPSFLVKGIPRYLNTLSNRTGVEDQALNIEPCLMEKLLPFQLEGIRFVIKQGGRAMIGDEMGEEEIHEAASLNPTIA